MGCAILLLSTLLGCTTFQTRKVVDDQITNGYPFIFNKPYTALVKYDDSTTSTHILSLPTLYAVDVKQSPLGTTDTSLENNEDGFAKKATAKIDHKIPENIGAVTELLKELGVKASGAPGAPEPIFNPELDLTKTVVSIQLSPIN